MKYFFALVAFLFLNQAAVADWQDSQQLAKLFAAAGVEGTFVIYDVSADRFHGYDHDRANKQFVPASTFKIPHTLIGLSAAAVQDVDEVLPYGGGPQPFEDWKRDMSLREAIVQSCVPICQELARRIGIERMYDGVSRLEFGNQQTGSVVDHFWLSSPLKISAIEQARFLARLARSELPFPEQDQASVREIVRLEQGNNWTLYGKTGWENAPGQGVGWWVGWVHKDNQVYAFALNIDIWQADDATRRMELGKASLKALGMF